MAAAITLVIVVAVLSFRHQRRMHDDLTVVRGQTTYLQQRQQVRSRLAEHVPPDVVLGFTQPVDPHGDPLTHSHAFDLYRYLVSPYRLEKDASPSRTYVIADIRFEHYVAATPGAPQRRIVAQLHPGVFLLR